MDILQIYDRRVDEINATVCNFFNMSFNFIYLSSGLYSTRRLPVPSDQGRNFSASSTRRLSLSRLVSIDIIILALFHHPYSKHVQTTSNFFPDSFYYISCAFSLSLITLLVLWSNFEIDLILSQFSYFIRWL